MKPLKLQKPSIERSILFKDISIYNHFMKMKKLSDAIETGKEGYV